MELFHGSNVIVLYPKIITNGTYKAFGYGFYCTRIEKQAKRWAMTKRNIHVVNVYNFSENKNLKILRFNEMNEQWLDL